MAAKIKNIESLNEEIEMLQAKAEKLEEQLDDNFDHLQDNYSSMIMNSVFSGSGTGTGMKGSVIATVAGLVLGNERIQNIISSVASHLIDKTADGLEKLANKLMKNSG